MIYTWIGVVSGIVTILLAFSNPFENKVKLDTYVKTIEYVPIDYVQKKDELFYLADNYTSITIKNIGELPARQVHVNFQNKYSYAIVLDDKDNLTELSGEPIYIELIEPDDEVVVILWSPRYHISAYNLDEVISVSSEGGGKSKVRTDIQGEGFSWILEEYSIFFFMGSILLIVAFLSILGVVAEQDRKTPFDGLEKELRSLNYAWTVGAISEEEFQKKSREIAVKRLEIE